MQTWVKAYLKLTIVTFIVQYLKTSVSSHKYARRFEGKYEYLKMKKENKKLFKLLKVETSEFLNITYCRK